MKLKPYLLYLLITTCIFSCKKQDTETQQEIVIVKRSDVLTPLTSIIIVPTQLSFKNKTKELNLSAITFRTSPDVTNLNNLRACWRQMMNTWKKCEGFNIGKIRESFLHNRIESKPANVNFIETNIQGEDSITNDYVALKGSSSRGISGIEYLIFGDNQSTNSMVDSFTISQSANRRLDYLLATTKVLNDEAEVLYQSWQNYEADFSSDESSGVKSAFNQMINKMTNLNESMVVKKLGKPMGRTSGLPVNLRELESYRSENSLENLKSNLWTIKKIMFLNDNGNTTLSDYLNHFRKESELSEDIRKQIQSCENKMNEFNTPLEEHFTTDIKKVEELYDELLELLILLEVDLAGSLSIVPTANDNDGD